MNSLLVHSLGPSFRQVNQNQVGRKLVERISVARIRERKVVDGSEPRKSLQRASSSLPLLVLLVMALTTVASGADPTEKPASNPTVTAASPEGERHGEQGLAEESMSGEGPALRFAFSGASWRDVLTWLADESALALHIGDLPVGTFSYSDPSKFTVDEAISRLNLFLIPEGFAIVKRGGLLSVISLGDPRSLQQLDALAVPTSIEELATKNDQEIVKCMVPLGEVVAEEAIAEMRPLMLMLTPTVLPKSNQLIVTETAMKVRSVLKLIEQLGAPQLTSAIQRFNLKHVDFATVMTVAGSHVGLAPGQSEGPELSISSDLEGKTLYVAGTPELIAKLESLIQLLDVPSESAENATAKTLRSYAVTGDNLQDIHNVLQTILADQSLRLSMQPSTKSIVAFATPEVHGVIQQTIEEMQAPAISFAAIDLQTLDPYFALALIEELFVPAVPTKTTSSRDVQDPPPPAPKVDADPGNRRLFVRGTTDQIEQIQKMISDLDVPKARSESVRFLPLRNQNLDKILEMVEREWRGQNRIQIRPSIGLFGDESGPIERVMHEDEPEQQSITTSQPASPPRKTRGQQLSRPRPTDHVVDTVSHEFVSSFGETLVAETLAADDLTAPASPIRGQITPEGIVLQSDDVDALDRFQEQLQEMATAANRAPSRPVIYYLKYVNADDAVKMLADLLDGGRSLAEIPGNTLINGNATAQSWLGFGGSFTLKKDGMTTLTSGTATIVSDARLNRLIVLGTNEDIAVIDDYMKIVDKANSITNIETFGRTHVIELQYTKAEDVVETVKEAFANRIASPTQNNAQGANRPATDPRSSTSETERRDPNAPRELVETPTRGKLPEMTVAAHEASNSVVVTAPEDLYREVESLVKSIDTMSRQVVEVVPAREGVDLESIMRRLNGEATSSTSSRSTSSRSTSSSNSRSSSSRSSSR